MNKNKPPGKWILVVEDEDEVADVVVEGLKRAGFRVIRSADVGDANTKLAQQQFACIVTDLVLGKGDGARIIAGVRASKGVNANIPILLMSGNLNLDLVKQLRPLINNVLLKPFDLKTLVVRVCDLLGMPVPTLEAPNP